MTQAISTKFIKDLLEATRLFGTIYKIELYKKVILAYDCDLDERLKEAVDYVTTHSRAELLAIHECDGSLCMIWKNKVPGLFLQGKSLPITYSDGAVDEWHISESVTSQSIEQFQRLKRLEQFDLGNLHVN